MKERKKKTVQPNKNRQEGSERMAIEAREKAKKGKKGKKMKEKERKTERKTSSSLTRKIPKWNVFPQKHVATKHTCIKSPKQNRELLQQVL